MTVGELIAALQTYLPETPIYRWNDEFGVSVSIDGLSRTRYAQSWAGTKLPDGVVIR